MQMSTSLYEERVDRAFPASHGLDLVQKDVRPSDPMDDIGEPAIQVIAAFDVPECGGLEVSVDDVLVRNTVIVKDVHILPHKGRLAATAHTGHDLHHIGIVPAMASLLR